MAKKTFYVEYKISIDDAVKTSQKLTNKQAIDLILYCVSKNYAYCKIITI